VGLAFAASGDVFFSMAPLIAPLLDAGIRVLNYAGKADSRCDYFVRHPFMLLFAPLNGY